MLRGYGQGNTASASATKIIEEYCILWSKIHLGFNLKKKNRVYIRLDEITRHL